MMRPCHASKGNGNCAFCIRRYAKWGVDYVKSDNCATYALDPSVRFAALRDALNATDRYARTGALRCTDNPVAAPDFLCFVPLRADKCYSALSLFPLIQTQR